MKQVEQMLEPASPTSVSVLNFSGWQDDDGSFSLSESDSLDGFLDAFGIGSDYNARLQEFDDFLAVFNIQEDYSQRLKEDESLNELLESFGLVEVSANVKMERALAGHDRERRARLRLSLELAEA